MSRERRRAISLALPTAIKAALLSIGVPLTLLRLFEISAQSTSAPWWDSPLFFLHVLLVIAALLWLKTLWLLARDVGAALRGSPSEVGNWSARWAGTLATLAMTLLVLHAPLHGHPRTLGAASLSRAHSTTAVPSSTERRMLVPHEETATTLGPQACLSELALKQLGAATRWPEISNAQMDRLQNSRSRFVDPSLLRSTWCLTSGGNQEPSLASSPPSAAHRGVSRSPLEELAWLGLGVLGTAALLRRLHALRAGARTTRDFGERLPHRDAELEALEARLEPFAQATLIDWIEVANRTLRLVAHRRRVAPTVQLVRAGPDGVTFFLERAIEGDVTPFVPDHALCALTLPLTDSLGSLRARCRDSGRMVPPLIPVGDDGLDCWLVAVGAGQQLTIDADFTRTQAALRGITTALRTLPWAEELHIELMELAPPPANEQCYQMTSSSAAAIADLAAAPPEARATQSTPAWRREPLIITPSDETEELFIPAVLAVAGVIQPGAHGSAVLVIDERGARLEPFGIELHVPQPDAAATGLIERLLSRAATLPVAVPLDHAARARTEHARPRQSDGPLLHLGLLSRTPSVDGLTGGVSPGDIERVVEVLAYLHLHGESATRDALSNALFPRASSPAQLIDDALAATRRALDAPRALQHGAQLLQVPFTLDSDWAQLTRRTLAVQYEERDQALLELEGLVATSSKIEVVHFRWLDTEGHVSRLYFELCDALHHLGTLALQDREFELAALAIGEGLRIEPASELLVRDVMLLRHETDGVAGVTESYEHLENSLAESVGREPNWTTRALFFELAGRSS